jgi:truncated hemoglobin YjbI
MIGGEPVVIATVTEMYARIMKDPLLFPFFEHSDVMNQIRMQKKFLTTVLKERDLPQFAKISMKYAHSKLGLNNTHFDRIKCIIGDCLLNQGVTTELVAATLSFTEKFRNYIVISDEPKRTKSTLR